MRPTVKKILLLINFFFIAFFAEAQTVVISGKIFYKENGKPLEGAQVVLEETSLGAVTDANGKFKIENAEAGKEYVLTVLFVGMKNESRKIVAGAKSQELNFILEAQAQALNEVTVNGNQNGNGSGSQWLRSVEGTSIYAGKKSEVIVMEQVAGNLAANNSRQIYSRIAGLNIWESDGAGIQLGIGGRGLNPNRTGNFNTRQNGYDISADALGYPENYYTPPAEAIDRIEIVRGAASLQYGTQFGGMINFRLKEAPADKPLAIELRNTVGTYGFFGTFNSIGGTVGKLKYYSFYQFKRGNGWRENSDFNTHTAHFRVGYNFTKRAAVTAEFTTAHYLLHQPGGLTDALFEEDPRQSIRDRNWFRVRWNIPSLAFQYDINDRTKIDVRTFALIAERKALGYLGPINRADPIQERDLIVSEFRNVGAEGRFLHRYYINGHTSCFLVGARVYNGNTHSTQGLASDDAQYDFDYVNSSDGLISDHRFPSFNAAVFAENIFAITPKFNIIPGIRFEYINTSSDGYYIQTNWDNAGNVILRQKMDDAEESKRAFVLAGLGFSYKLKDNIETYANISQNYRAINFNDLRIVNPNFRIDPNMTDEKGFSADIGLRGTHKNWLAYDANIYLLSYNDKIGSVQQDDGLETYRYRTNVADARNFGVESFIEIDFIKLANEKSEHGFALFSNFTIQDGRYLASEESAFDGKKVELVPNTIFKTGITYKFKGFRVSTQFSHTSEHFTDATNVPTYTYNAVNGIIPSYYVMDLSLEYTFKKQVTLSGNINNLTNNMYFTRRAEGYPGPGIIPSDGISAFGTVAWKWAK